MSAVRNLEQAGHRVGEALEHVVDEAHAQAEHAETSTGLDHRKLVMWIFIASECIFFAALMATFLVYKGKTPLTEGAEHLDLWVASSNTFILLFSSLTMVLSLQSIEQGKRGRMIFFLIATALLGLVFLGAPLALLLALSNPLGLNTEAIAAFFGQIFLGGQTFEYYELLVNGVSLDTNLFGATFFTLTGFHGAHVAVGVVWIIMLIVRALRGGITEHNHLAVELGGLYWHFVDLVWVVLFTIIYLI